MREKTALSVENDEDERTIREMSRAYRPARPLERAGGPAAGEAS